MAKPSGRPKKDLTGQTFGRLKVQYPTDRRDHHGCVIWHCICSCKKETDVSSNELIQHLTESCGCLKKENQKRIHTTLHKVDNTCIEWLNRKARTDNHSGYTGVTQVSANSWRASIGFQGKRYYLGYYPTPEKASSVYQEAKKNLHDAFTQGWKDWKERADKNSSWAEKHPFSYRVEFDENGMPYCIIES